MKKNVKRINENQLRAIVAESVKNVLKEGYEDQRPFRLKQIILQRIKNVQKDMDFLSAKYNDSDVDINGVPIDSDESKYNWNECLKKILQDFRLLLIGCGMSPKDVL